MELRSRVKKETGLLRPFTGLNIAARKNPVSSLERTIASCPDLAYTLPNESSLLHDKVIVGRPDFETPYGLFV